MESEKDDACREAWTFLVVLIILILVVIVMVNVL